MLKDTSCQLRKGICKEVGYSIEESLMCLLLPMAEQFFDQPILNSPYEYPALHWELDEEGQPTNKLVESRRPSKFLTPIPKPKKRRKAQDDV